MKGPMPSIELDDISPEEIMKLSREELDKMPFDIVRWQCKIKLCKSFTRMRDYGIHPWYYHPRGVVRSDTKETEYWINVYRIFRICGKHFKAFGKREIDNIPLKKNQNGTIRNGWDDTKKETIIY